MGDSSVSRAIDFVMCSIWMDDGVSNSMDDSVYLCHKGSLVYLWTHTVCFQFFTFGALKEYRDNPTLYRSSFYILDTKDRAKERGGAVVFLWHWSRNRPRRNEEL